MPSVEEVIIFIKSAERHPAQLEAFCCYQFMKWFDPFAPHNRLQFCKKEIWHIHVWKVPLTNALLHNRAYHFQTLHMQIINWYKYLRMIFSSVKTRTLL